MIRDRSSRDQQHLGLTNKSEGQRLSQREIHQLSRRRVGAQIETLQLGIERYGQHFCLAKYRNLKSRFTLKGENVFMEPVKSDEKTSIDLYLVGRWLVVAEIEI